VTDPLAALSGSGLTAGVAEHSATPKGSGLGSRSGRAEVNVSAGSAFILFDLLACHGSGSGACCGYEFTDGLLTEGYPLCLPLEAIQKPKTRT
jgi:hypothetical protein